jgi:DNA-binding response OmpR family regulator
MHELGHEGKVCVIDDDELVRHMVTALLKGEGLGVVEASDGDVAMALLGDEPPSLIITDIMMPNRDGIEIVRDAKRRFPNTPILVMSGSSVAGDVDYLQLARKLGADALIKKPFDHGAFLERVNALLHPIT